MDFTYLLPWACIVLINYFAAQLPEWILESDR